MQLNINDTIYNIDQIDSSRKLLWVLRDELGLIGTAMVAVLASAVLVLCISMVSLLAAV